MQTEAAETCLLWGGQWAVVRYIGVVFGSGAHCSTEALLHFGLGVGGIQNSLVPALMCMCECCVFVQMHVLLSLRKYM